MRLTEARESLASERLASLCQEACGSGSRHARECGNASVSSALVSGDGVGLWQERPGPHTSSLLVPANISAGAQTREQEPARFVPQQCAGTSRLEECPTRLHSAHQAAVALGVSTPGTSVCTEKASLCKAFTWVSVRV